MSIHPQNGVPAAGANNAFAPSNPSACDKYYPNNGCAFPIEPDQLNALVSEIRRVIDAVGDYDCNATDNLVRALAKFICQKSFTIIEGAPTLDDPVVETTTVTNPDGSVTVCTVTTSGEPCPAIQVDGETGCIWVYDASGPAWLQVGKDIQFSASAPDGETSTLQPLHYNTTTDILSVYNPISESWIQINNASEIFIGLDSDTPHDEAVLWYQTNAGVLLAWVVDTWVPILSGASGSPSLAGIAPMLLIEQTRAGSAAAASLTNGAWTTRILNNVAANQISGASVNTGTGVITLPAGTYRVQFTAMAANAGNHRARLWNITDGAAVVEGMTADSYTSGGSTSVTNASVGVGRFAITATKTFRLEHYKADGGSATQGNGNNISPETHYDAFVEIVKEL